MKSVGKGSIYQSKKLYKRKFKARGHRTVSFWDKFVVLSFAFLLVGNDPALAMAMMSPSDSSTPEFWYHANDSKIAQPAKSPEEAWNEMRAKVLADDAHRISPDFEITEPMQKRTEFWFDIYTRYGSDDHVIHNALYPWIVYKVVNTSQIVASAKGPTWMRRDRGEKFAKNEANLIRRRLLKMSKHPNAKLSDDDKALAAQLKEIPGSRRKVFRQAANNLRTQLGQRDFFRDGLANSSRYLPYMEEKFQEMGLPVELTRIPFVESSFNEKAFSKAGASGVWQIMPRTGRAYMIVSDRIDERNSPLKATLGAALLLKSYYHSVKTWPLAITSYNHGIGNIHVAIRKAHSTDLATIIKKYHSGDFKFASANYYSCFLAALHAEKYNELVFNDLAREPFQEREVVYLKTKTSIKRIQALTGLTRDELLSYNLDLRNVMQKKSNMLPRGYELHIPKGSNAQASLLGNTKTAKMRQTNI
jgi:membrane-bound lytic murein transglycosylase D